ncbi:hypothetical protein [Peribacillus butanolivorans]|uniref:hypothetical protein n=1 Tax=Peribacillus butanolivorans TaxID=421767 RepID=UPI0035DCCAE1
MKKSIYSVSIIFILVIAGYFVYFLFFSNTSSNLLLTNKEIKESNFLHKKKAIVYFSTTADQDLGGDGISYAAFIDKDGNTQGLLMEGLELGSMAVNKKDIYLEEKDKVRIVGGNYKEFPMENDQYTGELTGYLEEKNIYFSIYNSGFKGKGYNSDVRYGNEKAFKTGTIPYYIASSGLNEEKVNILTQDDEQNKFDLKEVTIDTEIAVKQLTSINTPKDQDLASLSPILSDNKYYYFILYAVSDNFNAKTYLYRIEKSSKKQEIFDFIEYKNMKNIVSTIPYNIKNSTYIYKNELYYVNGLGDVYTFNTLNEKITKKFTIKDASHSKVRHNEETYFKNKYLYILRYSEKNNEKYYLEKYNIGNGKLNETINIKGLNDLLNKNHRKSVYSYDLKILD